MKRSITPVALNTKLMIGDPQHTAEAVLVMRVVASRADQSTLSGQWQWRGRIYCYRHVDRMSRDWMVFDIAQVAVRAGIDVVVDELRRPRRMTVQTEPLPSLCMRIADGLFSHDVTAGINQKKKNNNRNKFPKIQHQKDLLVE